ncbi:response regulator transcription factor [Domibacillus epiphyticus]|uniref:DNA-binding response regulator n=1 Tax=Domibacillus epiphyticus TaxID=1714355 RepID=A0A1V2AC43_9BACI|nr:response regulator transcription factor [Domibacillus epiphyticus]OMP68374.1 DNA-binding response regulator [Domibacillus epiphyticus]
MSDHILIIEDDEHIARVIQLELEYEGFKTSVVHSGREGLALLKKEPVQLVILDVMIPELNGMEVLRRIRSMNEETIVIMLTARNSVYDKVSGLDLGANDYMTKPFEIEELLARIRTHLRFHPRKRDEPDDSISIRHLMIRSDAREVYVNGSIVDLTPREYDLLMYLAENKNRALERGQIVNQVWGYDYFGDTNVVDVYIRYLRKKLQPTDEEPFIQTVRGVGYMIKD